MNTPKIRFKGFKDDWEQRKVSDEVDSIDTGKSKFDAKEIGEYEILGSTGVIGYDDLYDYEGDFLLTARVGANAGTLYRRSGKVKITDNTVFLQGNNIDFVFCLLDKFDLKKLSFGSGQPLIKASELKNLMLQMPASNEEKNKIAEYFNLLDHLITLHQRKCNETKQLKKFMLQKMFPKNGEKNPEIRFEGFTDDWEQRKFGDYNDLMTGYPFESDKFSEDGIKLVRGMNVKRGYLDFSGDICVKWNSCVGLENFLLKDGDILIQMDGALIGKSYAKIKENQLPALLVQRVTRARTNNKFASQDFMYQTIQRDFLRYIEMNKTETAVPHLSLNDIRNFEIMVPCLAEQKKIGEYFDSLDNLITLHQRKCEKLKELKKYMLQNMFV